MKKITHCFYLSLITGVLILTACGGKQKSTASGDPGKDTTAAQPQKTADNEPYWRKIKRAGTSNGNRFFTDENGTKLFNGAVFYNAHDFRNGYCIVSVMGEDGKEKRGIIDEKGKFILECTNDYHIRDFENSFFEIANPKVGYLNAAGVIVIPMEYTASKGFSGNMVKLEKNYKKWGILNEKGEEVVPFIYDGMGPWKQGLTAVKKGKKWGFIDRSGQEVIACHYDMVYGFEHGMSLVQNGKKFGFINAQDETVVNFVFTDYKEVVDVSKDEISETGYRESNKRLVMEEGYIILKKGDKWGYLDTLGKEVIPFEYDYIGLPSSSGKIQIEKGGRRGNYDLNTKKETLK